MQARRPIGLGGIHFRTLRQQSPHGGDVPGHGRIGHIAASGLSVEFQKGPWEEWTTDLCDGRTHPENDTIGLWARALNTLEGVLTKENPPGYAGVSTGMTFFPSPGNLSSTIERMDYSPMYKKGVIKYSLKVLP